MAATEFNYLEPRKVTITNVSDKDFRFQMYRVNLWKTLGGVDETNPDGQKLFITAASSEEAVYYDSLETPEGVTIVIGAIE